MDLNNTNKSVAFDNEVGLKELIDLIASSKTIFFLIILIFPWGLKKLKIHKTIEAKIILQNDIDIAPTFSRALPIMGDVLTENRAKISSNVIFIFIINY